MKTNISNLMNLAAEYERNLNTLSRALLQNIHTVTIKELDDKENIINDSKNDFQEEYAEYMELSHKIASIKKSIYLKNNELKLPDGISIQDALVEVSLLRKKQNLLNQILTYKNTTQRITEVNNSYFECRKVNFDAQELKIELNKISEKIQTIEFEISKLNSLEFEIEL